MPDEIEVFEHGFTLGWGHAYDVGWADGYERKAREVTSALTGVGQTLRGPSQSDLEQARTTLRTCSCRRCSTCVRRAAIDRNRARFGSDDYPGATWTGSRNGQRGAGMTAYSTEVDPEPRYPVAASWPETWGTAPRDTSAAPAGRKVEVTWASTIVPEAVVWAWTDDGEGRIPAGTLTILAGREGTGKSSCALWLAARITAGTLPGSLEGKPRSVLIAATEDSWRHTLVPRLMAAGADLERVGRIDVTTVEGDEVTLSLPDDLVGLEATIRRHDVGLVVLDPLLSMIGDGIDTHRSRDVRSALDPLAKLADKTGAIVCGIAHFNKSAGTDAASLITGSGAFKDVPRSVFGFARDDDGRVMTQVKNSLGRDDLPSLMYSIESVTFNVTNGITEVGKFVFNGTSERSVSDVLRDSRGDDDRDERAEVVEWLTRYLIDNGGEAHAGDVLKAARRDGFADRTVQRARKKVATAERRGFGSGGSWVWQLIGDTKDAIDDTPQKVASMAPMAASMAARPSDSDCGHPDNVRGLNGRCALCIAASLTESGSMP